MERDLLLKMINERMFVQIVLTLIVFYMTWFFVFRLGFEILHVKIKHKQISPAICIMVGYALIAKQYISLAAYGVVEIPIVIFLFAATEKIVAKKFNILKSSWTALLSIVSNALGFITIIAPLSLNKEIEIFFNNTIYGYNTACVIETLGAALVLFVLIKFPKVSLIPPIKDKIDLIDIVAFITYFAMLSVTYSASVLFVTSLTKDPQHVFGNLIYQWLTTIIIVPGHYLILRNMKKERNRIAEERNQILVEKAEIELEKRNIEEAKNIFESENAELLKRVEELMSMNHNGESLVEQQFREYFNEYVGKIQNVMKPNRIRNNEHIDKGYTILNKLTGKSNEEITKILGLNDRDAIIFHAIIQNKSNKEIGEMIYLAEGSAGNAVGKFLSNFELKDRDQLLPYIIEYFIQIKVIRLDNSSEKTH